MSTSPSAEGVANQVIASAGACSPTGSWFYLKDAKYAPVAFNTQSNGRFHDFGTGSLYLGDSLETCRAEVRRDDLAAYSVNVSKFGALLVLDLAALGKERPELKPLLLIESASGGWEPTIEISRRAREMGYGGIQYSSQANSGGVCVVFWADKTDIQAGAFERLHRPADSTAHERENRTSDSV